MKQVSFAVAAADGWGLTGTECLWCEIHNGHFELQSVPFGVRDLAVGDRFQAKVDPVSGCIFEHELIKPSGHSLILVRDDRSIGFDATREYFHLLGCRTETLSQCNLLAVDIPASVDCATIVTAVDQLGRVGFEVLPRVWRHSLAGDSD